MPFDGSNKAAIDRGFQLVHALRNMPPTHKWNFGIIYGELECGTVGCACGLVKVMWPNETQSMDENVVTLGEFVGITNTELAISIFGFKSFVWAYDEKTLICNVTPEMVADALETELQKVVKSYR